MPLRLRVYVGAITLAGAVAVVVASVTAEGHFRPGVAVGLAALLAVTHVFPLVVLRKDDLEGLQLDEAFLVAMALLLPPSIAVLTFAAGTVVGQVGRQIVRHRSTVKTVFNIGQFL